MVFRPLKALFGVLFAVPFVLAGLFIMHTGDPYKGGVQAVGTVISNRAGTDSDGARIYTPTVRFTDSDGVAHVVESHSSSSSPASVGATRKVSYRPGDPDGARVVDKSSRWFGLLFMGFAVVWAVLWVLGSLFPSKRASRFAYRRL